MLSDSGRLNPALAISDKYHHKQRNREANTERKCLHGAIALAFVAHQENEGGTEAGKDQNEGNGDEDFHEGREQDAIANDNWRE